MTTHRPSLDDLSVLTLVAETGSIGAAAHLLGLTQPSVSRRMAALERQLRIQVLQRSRRGSELTPAGRVVVDWASALLSAADDFSRSVQTLAQQTGSTVRAGASMTIAEHHAPRWLDALRRVSPDMTVAMTVANSTVVADGVESGALDIGFVESPRVRGSLRARRVATDEVVVAVPPGHPWARQSAVAPSELAGTGLLVREEGSGTRETLERGLQRHGLQLTAGLELASNTALKSAAVAGMGPVVVSASALENELRDGVLTRVQLGDLDTRRQLRAVWRRDRDLTAGAAALLRAALGHSRR